VPEDLLLFGFDGIEIEKNRHIHPSIPTNSYKIKNDKEKGIGSMLTRGDILGLREAKE